MTRAQLVAAGLTRHGIGHRLKLGRLHVIERGVYAVGHAALAPLARETAAVLRFDGRAVLSHASAAALWGLAEPTTGPVTVTLVGGDVRGHDGLHVHRAEGIDPVDIRLRHGLPVTGPARTLIDWAPELSPDELERAVAEARVQRLLGTTDLQQALVRAGRRRGSAAVRGMLAGDGAPAFTRQELEVRMLRLVRHAGLPEPVVNSRVLGFEADFCWPAHRLVVETDGLRFHRERWAFERDRRRDQVLVAAGWRVMRITWRQLIEEPMAVVARLAMALTVSLT